MVGTLGVERRRVGEGAGRDGGRRRGRVGERELTSLPFVHSETATYLGDGKVVRALTTEDGLFDGIAQVPGDEDWGEEAPSSDAAERN